MGWWVLELGLGLKVGWGIGVGVGLYLEVDWFCLTKIQRVRLELLKA